MSAPEPPTVRALLLTDVVDSTRLSERIGDSAMAQVWAAHDRVARDLLPPWRGREIDKTDGMLLLFDRVADAVQYALAYHAGLAAIAETLPFELPWPLRARAGLHVGPVILRENAPDDVARGAKPLEVDGLAKPTAARVMSLARGGQTLITPQAREALAEAAAPALAVQSHGHWMIKGVTEPVELFEVGPDAAAFAAPPDGDKVYRVVRLGERWLPVREVPNNLPTQATTFVGRERELGEIKALLGAHRLVTLLGMGGLGKTRLSLQVAAEMRAEYPDGTWFIDLSPLREPALVAAETAQVLGARDEPPRPLLQVLASFLASRRALLVLDNCEHLVQAAAQLVHAIARAAPSVCVLASSRELLRVPGEHAYPVHPLPVPATGRRASLAAVQGSAAVRLFVERAQAQKAGWVLTEAEAPAVAELVARLEGIPLALELAAARVRVLPVAEINKRLNDRYKLLTGGSRVLQERQQTLRALVDWSHELLQPSEQRLFRRLSVFVGGFELTAAEAVCADDELDGFEILDLLASLVDKSLVMLEERPDGARYRMLETLREYARHKLDEDGPEAAAPVVARHAEHYFALAKEVRRALLGIEQAQAVARMETEHDNVRAAMATALAGGVDPVVSVKLCVAMQTFWLLRGYVSEGRAAVRSALALPTVQAEPVPQAHALYTGAALATRQGDHAQARAMLGTCLALRRAGGRPVEVAATLSTLALAQWQGGDVAAAVASETEALQLFEGLADPQGQAIGHLHLGQFAAWQGDAPRALAHARQAQALAHAAGLGEVEVDAALLLGELDAAAGAIDAAAARVVAAQAQAEATGNPTGAAAAALALAGLDLCRGDVATAWPRLWQVVRVFQDFELRELLLAAAEQMVVALSATGEAPAGEAAARLAAAAQATRDALGLLRSPRDEARWQALLAGLRGRLAGWDQAWAEGQAAPLAEMIDRAGAVVAPAA